MASAVITKKQTSPTVKLAKAFAYGIINIAQPAPKTVLINEVLPFRISFTNIGIPSYTKQNPPGIGIAIIGLNNYIL